jgi:oligosaccharide reducing-end xylanase
MDRGRRSADPPARVGSYQTGTYRNLFATYLGRSQTQVDAKLERAWQQLFYGTDDSERVYFPVGSHSAYLKDVGNNDVRSEGMSYGMMIAVQLDKQEEFDRLWHWARTHMYHADGPRRGYFAWRCSADGLQLDPNSASDGEEWMAMALLFAAGRWGNGAGIYNYEAEAKAILHTMLHKSAENQDIVTDMFDPEHRLVVFVPEVGLASSFTDPSYHVPHFYELWARWAGEDNDFWSAAADASRSFLRTTAHPRTGLVPDYSRFDGTPIDPWKGGHDAFRFDAWRVGMNVAVDYTWFAADPWQVEQSNRWLEFFAGQGLDAYVNQYTLDGARLSEERSGGLIAMNAVAAMAATVEEAPRFVQALWRLEPPTGQWRYYDGMLYMLAMLHVSGRFQIHPPPSAVDR